MLDKSKLTLFIIKPDAILLRIQKPILNLLYNNGYTILSCKERYLNSYEVASLYKEHKEKKFFPYLVKYMQSNISYICLCEYYDISNIEKLRRLCGDTVPLNAQTWSIRGRYSFYYDNIKDANVIKNFVHTSCDRKSAEREVKIFFNLKQIDY